MKKKILIISGGISKERLISLDTGQQVAKELKKNGYIVKITEPDNNLANNIGLKKTKTKYALLLNPDTIVTKDAIKNFFIAAESKPDFWLLGPENKDNFDTSENSIVEVENLKGFALFFNLKKFDNTFFDENYFLYKI